MTRAVVGDAAVLARQLWMCRSLAMKDDLMLGWSFDVEEVSMAVFRVTGRDQDGRVVEKTGLDPGRLLCECKAGRCESSRKLNADRNSREVLGCRSGI